MQALADGGFARDAQHLGHRDRPKATCGIESRSLPLDTDTQSDVHHHGDRNCMRRTTQTRRGAKPGCHRTECFDPGCWNPEHWIAGYEIPADGREKLGQLRQEYQKLKTKSA